MPTLTPLAVLTAVTVDFAGRIAMHDVDLEIVPGRLTAVVGPNGAGKSTLLEVIAGTRTPSTGRVDRATTAVAYVPQRATVSDRLPVTVRDVVAVGAWGRVGAWRPLGSAGRAAIDDAMARLDIAQLAQRRFAALSGGQQQRALLAQGIARGAELMLIDEPTRGLDAASVRRIQEVMVAEAQRGTAVVCVTHDEAVIARADRVVSLRNGRIDATR